VENDLSKSILKIIHASSEADKKKCLRNTAKMFYITCVKAGLKRPQILSLATEVIGCFTEDINCLKNVVEKEKK